MQMIRFIGFIVIFIVLFPNRVSAFDCEGAREKLECLGELFTTKTSELEKVKAEVFKRYEDDSLLIKDLEKSSNDWQVAFESSCSSVYSRWRYSSHKNFVWLQCKIRYTSERISFLESTFLSD